MKRKSSKQQNKSYLYTIQTLLNKMQKLTFIRKCGVKKQCDKICKLLKKNSAEFSEKLVYFRVLLDICLYMFCLPDGLIILSL